MGDCLEIHNILDSLSNWSHCTHHISLGGPSLAQSTQSVAVAPGLIDPSFRKPVYMLMTVLLHLYCQLFRRSIDL